MSPEARGGVGGVEVRQETGTHVPSSPPLPDFVLQKRQQALRTVREATQEEIACLFNRQDRSVVIRVQGGWLPSTATHWQSVMTTASFLDHAPTEQGQEARENRDHLVAEIRKAHARLTAPPPDLSSIEIEREWPGEEDWEYEARCREIRSQPPPPPDPALVAKHQQNCSLYPWITFRLGYRTSPVVLVEPVEAPRPVRPPRDPFTLMSVRKARERARTRGTLIDPRWEVSTDTMYLDVVAEIGTCPPMVDPDGKRVYTLDRYPKPKRGYVPGNIRWANKSEQRDNQQRNGQTRASD
jgi:hypothetical protein